MNETIKSLSSALPDLVNYLCNPPPSIKMLNWARFNECTGGFRMHEYTILCGSTGSGKTSWLANLSADLVTQKVKHFVMSVETGHLDYMARVMSVFANEDLNTGDPIPKEKIVRLGVEHHEKLFSQYIELSLYDNRVPLDALLDSLEWAVANGCKLAFIDNINFFIEVTRASDQIIEMDKTIHALIMFCKRNPIHIVMVHHPNKMNRDTRVESEFDVKGSSTSVQEAQNVILFNRPKKEDIENGTAKFTDRELTISKMRRRGKYTGRTLVFDGDLPKYLELGYLHDASRDGQPSKGKGYAPKQLGLPYKDAEF